MAAAQTGADLITPEEAAKVQEVSGQVLAIQQQAQALAVTTADEAQAAAAWLVEVTTARKQAEAARVALVQPLNNHVNFINGQMNPGIAAMKQAGQVVKDKVLGYNRVQERLRQEEQARVDAENARREAAAEAERAEREAAAKRQREAAEAQAREAAEAAERAERERLEAIERDQGSRRARISRLSEESLLRIAATDGDDAAMANEELGSRKAQQEAQEAAQRAAAAEAEALAAEQAAAAAPAAVEVAQVAAPTKLAGTATRKRWAVEVTDPNALEDWARMPDMPEIRRQVKGGLRESPGLRIYQEDELAVRG